MCAAVNWNNDDRVRWTMKGGVVRKKQGAMQTAVLQCDYVSERKGRWFKSNTGSQKKKDYTLCGLSFLFYDGGLERTVQTNSPVDCLSVRGFSAEKQVQLRMSFLFCLSHCT